MLRAKLNTSQWDRALKELGKKPAIKAGIRAVNRTLTSSRSAVTKQVAPDVGLQQKVVRDQVTIVAAKNSGEAPFGALYATSKKIPLIQFKARQTKRGGVTAKLPSPGAGRYPHAFIVNVNGSPRVLERYDSGGRKGRRGKNGGKTYQLHGPSIYHAFRKHADVAQSRAIEVLDKNFQHEFDFLLAKAKQT